MTPRKWFWYLALAALVSVLIGTRVWPYQRPAGNNPPAPQRVQEGLGGILSGTLYPVSGPATWVQLQVSRLAPSQRLEGAETIEDLKVKLAIAQRLYEMTAQRNAENAEKLIALGKIQDVSRLIQAKDVLFTKITAVSSTMIGDTCTINVGSTHGVKIGMPLLCNAAVVGRVTRVNPTTSDVTFVTDSRQPKIAASLQRRTTAGNEEIVDCVVRGEGMGVLRCDSIGHNFTTRSGETKLVKPPEVGDRLMIRDANWPAAAQNLEFGVVTEVVPLPNRFYGLKAQAAEGLRPQVAGQVEPIKAFGGLYVLLFDK